MKNIKKLMLILCVNLLVNLTLFSQKTTLIDGDTSVCFSIPQSKFLLKQIYLVSEKDTLLALTETELKVCTEQKNIYQQQVQAYQQINNNQQELLANVTALSAQKDEDIKALNKQVAKQKVKTWVAILGGIVSTAFVSYLWISK